MVRKVSPDGVAYHEPPYTKKEEDDFYRRMGNPPITVVRGPAAEVPHPSPVPQKPTAK